MKSKVLIVLLAVFLGTWAIAAFYGNKTGCFGDNSFDATGPIDAWVELWNSYDLDQVNKLFLNCEKGLTYLSSEKEGVITGLEAVRKHHEGFGFVPGGKASENKLWVEDVSSNSYGESSVVTGVWHFQTAEKQQKGPFTIVYLERNGMQKIAHMHFANYSAE